MDVIRKIHSSQERLGLRFTIDYLLFNKESHCARGESNTPSSKADMCPRSNLHEPSRKVPIARGDLKLEVVERESECSEEDSRDEMGKKEEGCGTSGSENPWDKPAQSYIALISRAILASEEKKLLLCDIYQWIMDHYPYFKNKDKNWKNSVRHNLSLNECFVKAGRSENGKGHFWAIHPASMENFSKGDYRCHRARRRSRNVMGQLPFPLPLPYHLTCHPRSFICCCYSLRHQLGCYAASVNRSWVSLPVHHASASDSFI